MGLGYVNNFFSAPPYDFLGITIMWVKVAKNVAN